MKTDAVMCMAFTRQSPSVTPLLRTSSSTLPVMFTNPRRLGTSNHKCSVSDFMRIEYIRKEHVEKWKTGALRFFCQHFAHCFQHKHLLVQMANICLDVDVRDFFAREIDRERAVVRHFGIVLQHHVEITLGKLFEKYFSGHIEKIELAAVRADVNGSGRRAA